MPYDGTTRRRTQTLRRCELLLLPQVLLVCYPGIVNCTVRHADDSYSQNGGVHLWRIAYDLWMEEMKEWLQFSRFRFATIRQTDIHTHPQTYATVKRVWKGLCGVIRKNARASNYGCRRYTRYNFSLEWWKHYTSHLFLKRNLPSAIAPFPSLPLLSRCLLYFASKFILCSVSLSPKALSLWTEPFPLQRLLPSQLISYRFYMTVTKKFQLQQSQRFASFSLQQ